MDPEKTLEIMLTKAIKISKKWDGNEDAWELAEAVIAMNDWLVNGGFLPKIWRNKFPTEKLEKM